MKRVAIGYDGLHRLRYLSRLPLGLLQRMTSVAAEAGIVTAPELVEFSGQAAK